MKSKDSLPLYLLYFIITKDYKDYKLITVFKRVSHGTLF
jgi:hypothetical protein